ncbi:hypothetical protein [Halomonas cerina]|uniref:Uncharacterized protein n=1 Tax=Halomonas cerina TaxID=447424 RepID=A0A839V5N9_9GAMM|nr:hypothetical protein [Halomonas cerina]MBB3189308.1 hypothetical protein [Halomonas cerina]
MSMAATSQTLHRLRRGAHIDGLRVDATVSMQQPATGNTDGGLEGVALGAGRWALGAGRWALGA